MTYYFYSESTGLITTENSVKPINYFDTEDEAINRYLLIKYKSIKAKKKNAESMLAKQTKELDEFLKKYPGFLDKNWENLI